MNSPANTSTAPAMARIGMLSLSTRFVSGRSVRKLRTVIAAVTPMATPAMAGVTHRIPANAVATNRAGRVTMSPAAVTSGAATLSRSQPRRNATRDRRIVNPPTTTLESTPPMTEITMKSSIEMLSMPKTSENVSARTPRSSEMARVRTVTAKTFWYRMPSRSRVG
jgi:hypothetical protein